MNTHFIHSRISQPGHYRHVGVLCLCCGDCPVYGRMFSSLPGLYHLHASGIPPRSSDHCNQKCLTTFPNVPGGAPNSPSFLLRTTDAGLTGPILSSDPNLICGLLFYASFSVLFYCYGHVKHYLVLYYWWIFPLWVGRKQRQTRESSASLGICPPYF